MRTTKTLSLLLALAPASVAAQPVPPAQPAQPAPAAQPFVEHVPLSTATASVPTEIRLRLRRLERVARVEARWRIGQRGAWRVAIAERVEEGWRCVIPALPVRARELSYHLVLVDTDGRAHEVFGTSAIPHRVPVHPSPAAREELWDLAHARGRRLEFIAGGDYTDFGSAPNTNFTRCGVAAGSTCVDRYFTAWGMVRYRFHRAVRSVAVRVQRLEGRGTRDGETRDVGLVAADAEVEFRLARPVSLTLRGTLGANELSVQGGGGLQLDVGVGSPAVVSLSFHGITSFGMIAAAWLRFETVRDWTFGAGVDVTNQPSDSGIWGARLMLEVSRHFGRHVTVTARGGYGARTESAAGFSLGGAATLAF